MKKILAIVVLAIMVFALFAGCNQSEGDPAGTTPPSAKPTTTPSGGTSNETPEPTEGSASQFPLVDEPVTFKAWSHTTLIAPSQTDMNDQPAFLYAADMANLKFEWQMASAAGAQEAFNLSLVSGELPDLYMINSKTWWLGGLDKAVDEDYLLDTTELITQYAPNYTTLAQNDPEVYKGIRTDKGRIVGFTTIQKGRQYTYNGPMFRKDLLDKAGFTGKIETYDEWYNALKALKGVTDKEPLYLSSGTRLPGLSIDLMQGYNSTPNNSFYIQKNGKVEFSILSDDFKEYVTMMNRWFSEGLIDHDFASRNYNLRYEYAHVMTNDFGAFSQLVYTFMDVYEDQSEVDGYELMAVIHPQINAGDKRNIYVAGDLIGNQHVGITVDCDRPELLVQFFDYGFGEEGSLLFNYGFEGETFTFVNGEPKWTELITKNPDSLSEQDACMTYITTNQWPFYYDWMREYNENRSEKCKEATFLWETNYSYKDGYNIPREISMTEQESSEFYMLFNDIQTYIFETVPQFIMGTKPMSEYGDFIEQIESMGIDTCTKHYQSAYDRYLNR